jgi:predicted amidohydrolase YtcJ
MATKNSESGKMFADLVIVNGKVITVDSHFSIAEAVAVRDGRIIAVGKDNEVKKLAGENTRFLDLKRKIMLPGINDSHVHPSGYGLTLPPLSLALSYPTVKSIADIRKAMEEKAKTVKPGEWIQGFGWDEGYLDECLKDPKRHPNRWDLDPVSPNNPVCLHYAAGNTQWLNSKALELAGITKDTPAPNVGEIDKDPTTGEPTGIIKGLGFMLGKVLPNWTKQQKKDAIVIGLKVANADGVTSITEGALGSDGIGLPGGMGDAETISAYNDLYNEGELTARVNILMFFGEGGIQTFKTWKKGIDYIGIHTGFGNDWLRIAGAKIFADGDSLAKTAWMHEEYPGGGGNGRLSIPGNTDEERYDELIKMIVYAHEHGFQLGIHAIGDRTIDACVDGFIKAIEEYPWDARHYILHGNFVTPECINRMAKYNIGINVQTTLKWEMSDLVDSVLGKERSGQDTPLKWLVDAGIHVCNTSDLATLHRDWKQGVMSAVLRESKASGMVSGPEQRVSREDAIRMCTIEGAWQDHMENIKGSIEIGKLADFCVLGEDILTIDAHRIADIPVLMTIIGGKVVYNANVL